MLKQYNGLYNWLHDIDYKIQVIQCNECHLERCLSGKCSNLNPSQKIVTAPEKFSTHPEKMSTRPPEKFPTPPEIMSTRPPEKISTWSPKKFPTPPEIILSPLKFLTPPPKICQPFLSKISHPPPPENF